jgi:hypothetical protein
MQLIPGFLTKRSNFSRSRHSMNSKILNTETRGANPDVAIGSILMEQRSAILNDMV